MSILDDIANSKDKINNSDFARKTLPQILESLPFVTHGRAHRTFDILFTYTTHHSLLRITHAGLSHGMWSDPKYAPEGARVLSHKDVDTAISSPGRVAIVSESHGAGTGVEGYICFYGEGPSPEPWVGSIHWCNPYLGSNWIVVHTAKGYGARWTNVKGNNAQVWVDLYPTS